MASADPRIFDRTLFDAALRGGNKTSPIQSLALFRAALRDGRAALRELYQTGTNADTLLRRHAGLVDELLTRAWALHQPLLDPNINIALVAVGGYGRGELYPCSDVDLLLLLARDTHEGGPAGPGPPRVGASRKFFAAKFAEQRARHARFDDTAYNLEPNIKEGPGGLRDIQMIAWGTQRQVGSAQLHDLVGSGFL